MNKLYLLIGCLCGFLQPAWAQTLINPITGGGFDAGNTFALNGWTVVNSSANKWVVGTTTFNSAPNSAYVSVDGNPANYSYDNTTAHISHFYQQVTIPINATNVNLSFVLLGNIETDVNFNLLDGLEIFTDASLTVPVADALPGGTAVQQFFQFNPNATYVYQTINLNSLAGKTVFLIFSWMNDGDGIGSGPPASVDDVSLTYCIKNTNYTVTGGGGYCPGSPGAHVGLSGSVIGISYQLYNNGSPTGTPVAGTGAAIDFGPQTVGGPFTVKGTSGACTYNMSGSVSVSEFTPPTATAGSNAPICAGAALNLSGGGGISYTWSGPNSFTSLSQNPSIVSVTTAATGTYNLTVKDANGCTASTTTGVTINPTNTGTLTSAAGTNSQTICVNTPITPITYATSGATGASFGGLPAGVTGSWGTNVASISGSPSVTGTFNYTVTLTGGCPATINGTMTVTSNSTITLTSAAGTNAQTTCINAGITNITYTTTGATGATISGLPTGVTGAWAAGVVTISGTPTTTLGSPFNYVVTLTGGCGIVTATGSLTVNPVNTIILTSAAGTNAQTTCVNGSITGITYATTGATGALFSGLPPGVTGLWGSNVATISGAPTSTVGSPFTYTVTLTGGCGNVTASGSITVTTGNTISLTSGAGTNTQTVCINGPITPITYATAAATGATFSGLPAGVLGSWASNVVTISGTPTTTIGSPFNYTVILTGGCGTATAAGTITVNPLNSVTLTSAAGTTSQTTCINTAITAITYATTGATNATFSGLPTGVTGSWLGNIVTISGTPTATVGSPFHYTVTLTGGCGNVSATGTITVNPVNTITLASGAGTDAQTGCVNVPITNISYATTGATGATFSGLPAGVLGSWSGNVVTINGTPLTATGSPFNYSVTVTGGCGTVTASGTITVRPNNTITLSSPAGTDGQTACINTAITNITYSTTGATGATFNGLPAGVTGTWTSNVVTISGTPTTVTGSPFNYTVTLTGGCGSLFTTGTITVTPLASVTLVSAPGTDGQIICTGAAITSITYSLASVTGATVTGLPTGLTVTPGVGSIMISGTPTQTGVFPYIIRTTGGCGVATANGTITVNPTNTITLTSAAGTNAQTACTNTAITPITYATTGASGATFSGLPPGVTGGWAGNAVIISGTPTTVTGSPFTYAVTLTGGCGNASVTGNITVNPNNTITLTSPAGTTAQTTCINTGITNITYATTGATGATFSGLPPGVTGAWAGNVVTISGAPTSVAGSPFTYTVTLSGGCGIVTATGSLVVNPDNTITLTSAAGSNVQSVCISSAIAPVTYATTGAVGATFSGLPAGVTGGWAANVITISGTPTTTVGSPFNYTVTLTGGCGSVTAAGSITVHPNNTLSLTSAAGTSGQTTCINSAITNITYATTGATGAIFSGLPAGVTGAWAGNVVTLSGSPTTTAGSPFNYTITLTGGCGNVSATGTITVHPNNTITLTSAAGTDAQTTCTNAAVTNITYATGGATGATFSGLPPGVTGGWAANDITITGAPTTTAGSPFNYTVTLTGGCGAISTTGSITVTPSATVALISAPGSDGQSVCNGAGISTITYSYSNAAGISVTGLPTGILATPASGILTISGTPTQTGNFPYNIATSGGCGVATATGTINVQAAVGGTVASASVCAGGTILVTLSGHSGPITGWESSTDGGGTWSAIANTTTTLTATNVSVPTLYRAVINNGCGNVYSTAGLVGIHNLWTGATNADWNTASNWSDGQVPSVSCPNVYIPGGMPNQPVLNSGVATIDNLYIYAGAILTVSGADLQVGGTVTNTGVFDLSGGTIEFNGTAAQTIGAGTFLNNNVANLIISNTAGVTLAGAVDVYNSLAYGKAGAILNTGGLITLKSTVAQTAYIGDMTNHTINGEVTVERFVATGTTSPNHAKSWQFLGIPTQGQTINQSWQEGSLVANDNLHPGFGTQITGTGSGFDVTTSTPSMKVYDYATTNYTGVPGTGIPIYNQKGYFIFVRGDRSVTNPFAPATATVLRTKGNLFTPANPPPTIFVHPNSFESVGNPYAASVDLRRIGTTGDVTSTFIVWDPRLGSQNGYGAFQTLTLIGGDYYAVPGGTPSYPGYDPLNLTPNDYLQSGQAFLAQTSTTGTLGGNVTFNESAKASGNNVLFTTPNPVSAPPLQLLITTLSQFLASGAAHVVDGVLQQFGDSYSNAVDGQDGRKASNNAENLSIKTGGVLLAVESRHTLVPEDTIYFNLTGVTAQNYRFSFNAQNFDPMLQAFLVDAYTNIRTPINTNGITNVDFPVVNATGAMATNRFMIVFEPLEALPVTFTSIAAFKQDKAIGVQWRVANENNIQQYQVEKSTDGNFFTTLDTTKPAANNGGSAIYAITDDKPVPGYNYYRVRSIGDNGKANYTSIVKVLMGDFGESLTIFPNPVTDGLIHLQFRNEPQGRYKIRLLNKLGQLILEQQFSYGGGNATDLIHWDYSLSHGVYQVVVTRPDGTIRDIIVMY